MKGFFGKGLMTYFGQNILEIEKKNVLFMQQYSTWFLYQTIFLLHWQSRLARLFRVQDFQKRTHPEGRVPSERYLSLFDFHLSIFLSI